VRNALGLHVGLDISLFGLIFPLHLLPKGETVTKTGQRETSFKFHTANCYCSVYIIQSLTACNELDWLISRTNSKHNRDNLTNLLLVKYANRKDRTFYQKREKSVDVIKICCRNCTWNNQSSSMHQVQWLDGYKHCSAAYLYELLKVSSGPVFVHSLAL